jgi:hypothetical protein
MTFLPPQKNLESAVERSFFCSALLAYFQRIQQQLRVS